MQPQLAAVARQLQLIEQELRRQALWSEASPAPEALVSRQPFCVDSLAFEQWLQWVLLPRLRQLIDCGAELPRGSGIRAMAEQVFAGRLAALVERLGELDALLSAD